MRAFRNVASGTPVVTVLGFAAAATAVAAFAVVRWYAVGATTAAGFWYEPGSLTLPREALQRLGGPLTAGEAEAIERTSRHEIEQAFKGLRMALTDRRDAFWHVAVLPMLPRRGPVPNTGQSMGFGPLGGTGFVAFGMVALNAIRYAPHGASRHTIVEGMGRGVGRVAVHEFAHQIAGAADVHDERDENSYEYPSPERASQYYGQLHWTVAAPLLRQKIGRR
jgi:hypothetical protein